MVILNGQNSVYELSYVRTDNFVALKYKLAETVNENPVNIILKDENDLELDNNKYIPDEIKSLRYSIVANSNDIILKVGDNLCRVPKLIQVNPEQSILGLISIMMSITDEQKELVVFNDDGKQLSHDMFIKDCNLRNESVIKVCAKSDVELSLSLMNLTDSNEESISIKLHINDSIEDVKNKISHPLSFNFVDLILFTQKDYLESGRRLIDYIIKKDDVIFYFELQRHGHIEIGEWIKKSQIATIFRGKIIDTNRDIILKRYNFNEILSSLNKEERIKFIKYDITTLVKINTENHPRLVHMEAMFEKDNYFYIGLQLMNQSLKNCLPVTNKDDIFRYATQTLEGLSYLHEMKIIYRSLKCSSILLDGNKNVKLSNFHFSKYLLGGSEQGRLNDATRSKPVDKNWAAPEMLKGNAYGLQADIWSYGATLIEMITANPPYHGLNQSIVEKNLLDEIKPTYKLPAESPSWVGTIIEKCLNLVPLLRPKVDELIELINSEQ